MLIVCLTLWGTAKLFSQWLHHLHSYQQCVSVPISPHPCQCLLFFFFFSISSGHELVELVSYCDFFFFGHTSQHMGSWFPNQGWNPCSLPCKHGILTTGPSGNSLTEVLICISLCFDSLNMTQVFSLYHSLLAFATVPTFLCLPTGRGRRIRVNWK